MAYVELAALREYAIWNTETLVPVRVMMGLIKTVIYTVVHGGYRANFNVKAVAATLFFHYSYLLG
jgi:hypothetical protein